MSTEAVSSAILSFSTSYTYPDAEDIITAQLEPSTLSSVLSSLRKERDSLKQEIRALSKTNGSNVETWIDQAKRLQGDIQASRETARQIVEQHERGQALKADAADARGKIGLLEREIAFEHNLDTVLRQVKDINGLLSATQDGIVKNNLEEAHASLRAAKEGLGQLGSLRDSRCVLLLRERGKRLQTSFEEVVEQNWNSIFTTNVNEPSLSIEAGGTTTHASFITTTSLAQDLGLVEQLSQRLSKQIERSVLKPLFAKDDAQVLVEGSKIQFRRRGVENTLGEHLSGLQRTLDFLHKHMIGVVSSLVFARVLPKILAQIEEVWLEPAVPVDITQLKHFEASVTDVSSFIEFVQQRDLGDTKPLQLWLDTLPKAWITKRRETLLSEARNIVFRGIHKTNKVERIESQMISKDDAVAAQLEGGEEDWDNAWDDTDEQPVATPTSAAAAGEDEDDGSAWAVDEPQDEQGGGEDAWGWGDEGGDAKTKDVEESAPQAALSSVPKMAQREMTFKETYTVSEVPDEILQLIKRTIVDAQDLTRDDFAGSALARAAAGLYSLPTLALAIYRATAATAYSKLSIGNMLIYNDATRLSERLREWQAEQPPASRLRLDNDAKALDLFAKRAYSVEMESQKTILRDMLDGAQGFSNCVSAPFKQACESAVEQAADRLNDVHRQWKDILGDNALLQSVGQLLSSVTGKMISEIQDLSDIGEEDSKQLKLLCERLSAVKTLFAQQQADGDLRDMTFVYCPNWLKFQYLAEILESSLADIKFLWNEGELSLEFSSEEVVDLIKALFADSDYRRRLIAELRRQSRR